MKKFLIIKFFVLFIVLLSHISIALCASRSIYIDNCYIKITINPELESEEQGSYALIESLPQGLIVKNITENGVWDDETSSIYWGAYLDKTNKDFSYEIQGSPGKYSISGIFSEDGVSSSINGETDLQIVFCPLNFITVQEDILPAQAGVSYNMELLMEGGERPFSFEIIYGSLPPGLEIDSLTGTISGIPEKPGFFNFYLVASDSTNIDAEREFSIEVTENLNFDLDVIPNGTKDFYFYYLVSATGGKEPYEFLINTGELPSGIVLQKDGVLSGVCEKTGYYEFEIKVKDAYNNEFYKTFEQSVHDPLNFESQRLAYGVVGQDYSMAIDVSGGLGVYQWDLYSGMLPYGLEFNHQTGLISGQCQKAFYGTVVFSVSDADGRKIFKDFTMQISNPLKFTSQDLPVALKNEKYSEIIRIEGGIAPFLYECSGSMPSDLSFTPETGLIQGISTIAGSTNLYVTVYDSSWPEPQTISQFLKLRTTSMLTIITGSVLPRARRGIEINNIFLEAGGGSPNKWEISQGSLPAGIKIDHEDGKIWGTPAVKGPIKMTFKVTDENNNTATKEFIWHITDILNIETGILPDAAEGLMYNFSLQASGGITPYKWRLKNTFLPEGLSLNSDTGTIFGIPKIQTSQSITVEVSDSDNPPRSVEKELHMEVIADSLYIYTPELPSCQVNSAYVAEIIPLLGKPPYTWRLKSGVLPDGLILNKTSNIASIEGTPTKSGNYTFTIEISDSFFPLNKAQKTYTLEIYGDMIISNNMLRQAVKEQEYYDKIIVNFGLAPYSFSIINGNLPDGLELDAITGEIKGTVGSNVYESTEFTIQVQDSRQPSDVKQKTFVIYVSEPLQIITQTLPDGLEHRRYLKNIEVSGGIKNYMFLLAGGAIPQGLNLDFNSGILYGFPKESGIFNFSIKVKDSSINPAELMKNFQLNIIENDPLPVISGDFDANLNLDIGDAILILNVLSNMKSIPILLDADIDKNNQIGLIDAVMVLKKLSE